MNGWARAVIPASLLVLHNAQRFAPVPLVEELRVRLGTDYVGAGNLFGAFLFSYAAFNIPAGILADRINPRRLMVTGVLLSLLASAVFAFTESYAIAFSSRLALGLSSSFLYVPAVRYVVTSFREEKRGSVMGVVEVGAGIGMILSFTLLPFLAREFDLFTAFLLLPAIAALILGSLLFGLAPTRPESAGSIRTRFRTLSVKSSFWQLLAYYFLGILAHYAVLGWFPTFLRSQFGYSAVRAGLTSTLVTSAFIAGSPVAGIISDRLHARTPVLLSGSVMSVLAFVLLVVASSPEMVIGASLLSGVSMAFTIPIVILLSGELSEGAGAGLAVSIAAMTGQIATALSGMVFGYALQTSNSFTVVWGLALAIAAGSIPFLLMAMRDIRRMKSDGPQAGKRSG